MKWMEFICTYRKQLFGLSLALFGVIYCAAQNPIVVENARPGNPQSEWDLPGANAGDLTIQGFATDISVNKGDTVHFKISTLASAYTIEIYRLGYYNGNGARKVGTGVITATLPQVQPPPLEDTSTGLVDCGNWGESAYWHVPDSLVSGVYIAKLTRTDNNGSSHITFIVRDDNSTSDLYFQTSDATWQAYNVYGGNSLYTGSTNYLWGHGVKVSYNRPFLTRAGGGGGGYQQDWIFNAEYPMIRFLEKNGYDLSYTTNVDAARRGNLILNHKVFLSVGHDEYWSAEQRNNVTAARNAGVHLAFFSGNEIYWKTRWENSIDSTGTSYRTLVCYKEGTLGEFVCGEKCDPTPIWTGLWRTGEAYDAGLPENRLSGQISWSGTTGAIKVPAAYKNLRFWRNTSIATLTEGSEAVLPQGTLGHEWNWEQYHSDYPNGRITMSKTTLDNVTHKLSLYRYANGALVFGAGSVQWSWGLDSVHDRGNLPADIRMQQATVNLLADMNVQPETLQNDLVVASASTDIIAPSSTITYPADNSNVIIGTPVTITGIATDVGGVVAGVEISTDGGVTWKVANGDSAWSYVWTPQQHGNVIIKVRGFDDSGNLEAAGLYPAPNVISLNIVNSPCPCSLFKPSDNPEIKNSYNTTGGIELGVKFKSDSAGYISGLRFYKSSLDTGTHVVSLWSSTGTLIARDSLTSNEEKPSGWHQVTFDTAVAIQAGQVYVASYHSKTGFFAKTPGYFADSLVSGMLTGLRNNDTLGNYNGVYLGSNAPSFPVNGSGATNYWVDVVFITSSTADTIAPQVLQATPGQSQTNVNITAPVQVEFTEVINLSTVTSSTFELRDQSGTLVPATVTALQNTAELKPSSLYQYSSTYTVTLKGGLTGVTDLAGNPLKNDTSWTFTTAGIPVIPPANGPGGPILVVSSSTHPFGAYTTEILKAEGLNEYLAEDISRVDSATLSNYDVVILTEMIVNPAQAAMLTGWVNAGGKLITFRPSSALHSLLGITQVGGTLSDKYLLIDTSTTHGKGIVAETIQYHDAADLYTLNGATSVATLYSSATTATAYPAVTKINVGTNGGKAFAFAYDLPRSIVYTRQGNPALAGIEIDGQSPIRANDMFFTGHLDMNKVAIPQADEQQRLLANIIIRSNLSKKPLPRFWYMPKSLKAAMIYALDDHGTASGTKDIFDKMIANSAVGCSINDWECYRATSWFFTGIPLTSAQANTYNSQGFEMGVHVQNNCANFTSFSNLNFNYTTQIQQFTNAYPNLPQQKTNRFHCLVWSDWLTQAKVELSNGIRFSMDYYYWPANWVSGRPGLFTGSGMPMRFADTDGKAIDVYQGVSQIVNENGIDYETDVNTLLGNALGSKGYYGFFGLHDDYRDVAFSNIALAAAKVHNVPIITARQMLTWLDGRNASYFSNMVWNNEQLSFSVVHDTGAHNLTAMLPLFSEDGQLSSVTKDGNPILFNAETIKGIDYALFGADGGSYIATYVPINGTLIGAVTMQGRPGAPDTILQVPLEVTLYLNGDTAQGETYNVITDQNGSFSISHITAGTYTIAVKNSHSLRRVKSSQTIELGPNTIDFGILLEGDVNNDNYVDGLDASLLLNSFYKGPGDPDYNPQADLNGDGFVDGLDASLLLNNFYQSGEEPY